MESGRYIMIIADLNDAVNLQDYNKKLEQQLQEAHGNDYIDYLKKILELLNDCESYREIGTWQGASTSVALLKKIKYVETIDLSFEKINPYVDVFYNFAKEENINFVMRETDSLKNDIDTEVDFLLIDGFHNPKQVEKELKKYADWTKKYIMFHDTTLVPRLQKTVNNFLSNNKNWILESQHTKNVGYMVIRKC